MDTMDGFLDMASLVVAASEGIETYLLSWPLGDLEDGEAETMALALMRRGNGILLAQRGSRTSRRLLWRLKQSLMPEGLRFRKNGKPKRHARASLAAELKTVMDFLPKLSQQMDALAQRQIAVESKAKGGPIYPSASTIASQPLGRALDLPKPAQLSSLAKAVGEPPRTQALESDMKPAELRGLEAEELDPLATSSPERRFLTCPAVLEQSKALTSLAAQIAAQHGDSMTELAGISTTGTRGAAGGAKLQNELAMHRGTFFTAVLHQMGSSHGPYKQCGAGAPYPHAEGDIRLEVPGTFWWLWEAAGAGALAASSHDGLRLFDGGSGERCLGSTCRGHRTVMPRWRAHGPCNAAHTAGGPAQFHISESPALQHQQVQEFCAAGGSAVGDLLPGLPGKRWR